MLKAISLYSGIGGLDFGFEAAGFETSIAIELDKAACATMRLNRNWPVIERDIHEVSSQEIMDIAGVGVGEADVLIGGPPCQPFSKSSYWVAGDSLRLDDPRSDTLTAYLRVLRDLQPKAFLLENVHGIAFKNKDEGLQYLLKGIRQINRETGSNYSISWQKLNAADYGVPQIRERVFLIGSRDGASFEFPKPTHGSNERTDLFDHVPILPYKTAWDALGDLPQNNLDASLRVGGKWGDLLPSIPEGENYLWHTNRGGGKPLFGWRTRYWSFMLKLAKNRPSWTIQAQPGTSIGPFHWTSRKLTPLEMCRLQTFPDGLKFECGRTDVQKMLGNAVPSLLAEVLAKEIRRQLLGHSRLRKALKLLPPVRENIPPPEKVKPLAKKYYCYIGEHDDHPGEGKGRRSVKRATESQPSEQEAFA